MRQTHVTYAHVPVMETILDPSLTNSNIEVQSFASMGTARSASGPECVKTRTFVAQPDLCDEHIDWGHRDEALH